MNGAETRDTWPLDLPAPTSHLLSLLCRIMQMSPSQPELLTIWLIAVLCLMSGLCQVMWVLQAADGTYKIETRYVDGRVKGRQDMNNNWTNWTDQWSFQANTAIMTPRECWERQVTAPRLGEASSLKSGIKLDRKRIENICNHNSRTLKILMFNVYVFSADWNSLPQWPLTPRRPPSMRSLTWRPCSRSSSATFSPTTTTAGSGWSTAGEPSSRRYLKDVRNVSSMSQIPMLDILQQHHWM